MNCGPFTAGVTVSSSPHGPGEAVSSSPHGTGESPSSSGGEGTASLITFTPSIFFNLFFIFIKLPSEFPLFFLIKYYIYKYC